jgi:hypothetical protein
MPTPLEGLQGWYYDTPSSLHLSPDQATTIGDYGLDGAAGAWASPPHLPGQQDLSGTTGRASAGDAAADRRGHRTFQGLLAWAGAAYTAAYSAGAAVLSRDYWLD